MSSLNNVLLAGFNSARVQNNRYLTVVIFIIGCVGNIFNVIIFSQSTLNRVTTSRYFLAASGASLASLSSGLFGRIMAGWTADPASYNTGLCKFQTYTNKLAQTSCSYFILAASVDRWLQSNPNVHYRRMSSLRNSTRVIACILLVFSLFHSIHVVCFEGFITVPPMKCYAGSIICRYFENISYIFVTILIPQLTMLFFGSKTILNIRQSKRRIQAQTELQSAFYTNTLPSGKVGRPNNLDQRSQIRSLTRMLIMQVFTYILLMLPAAVEALYLTMTLSSTGDSKSDLQLSMERFFFAFSSALSYFAISLPFYLYTLTGAMFRQTLIKLLMKGRCCR